jgi:fructose-1,6-bisphosphatase/sedoheptulose 1,7-bisphosphatase-like protein
VEAGRKIAAVVVAPSAAMKTHIEAELAAVALLARIDASQLTVVLHDTHTDASFDSSALGQSVHLIVEGDSAAPVPAAAAAAAVGTDNVPANAGAGLAMEVYVLCYTMFLLPSFSCL